MLSWLKGKKTTKQSVNIHPKKKQNTTIAGRNSPWDWRREPNPLTVEEEEEAKIERESKEEIPLRAAAMATKHKMLNNKKTPFVLFCFFTHLKQKHGKIG